MRKITFKTSSLFLIGSIIFIGLYGCNSPVKKAGKDPLNLAVRDTSVSPAQDFFAYANGTWLKKAKIPANKFRMGATSTVIDKVNHQIKSILDSCSELKEYKEGSPAQQIGDLYLSAMDSTAINQAGLTPLQADLKRIAAIKTPEDIINEESHENVDGDWWWNWYSWQWDDIVAGSGQLCPLYVFTDDKNSNITRLQAIQGGLGLPSKSYYFKTDSASRHIIDHYKKYIIKILSLSGDAALAKVDAEAIFSLEQKLAEASKTPTELRNPKDNYHLMSVSEAQTLSPNLHWLELLDKMGIQVDSLLIRQPMFYQRLSILLKSVPVSTWKKYLTFHLISHYAPWLSRPFEEANFTFEQAIIGRTAQRAPWERAAVLVNNTIGEVLGKLYVARYFPPSYKAYMEKLVENLKASFREHIQNLNWMSGSTKAKAMDKLDAMATKIGYPKKWKDFSSIQIGRDSLISNLKRIGQWYYQYEIAKLHHPVDRSEWFMTPATVNAYNNPTSNDINFPAAILQPPFYFPYGDDAVNYGAIGAVIGHEMTHSFDNYGSQYDKYGSLKNWWTNEDRKNFEKRAAKIVSQYDHYIVLDSVHLNGKLDEQENIADNGGLAIAYTAFQKTTESHSDTLIGGLTPDQRFFVAYAQTWRSKIRPQILLWLVNNNGHSTPRYRVIGPLSNMSAFYKAFNVQPGDGMYRPDSARVNIW